MLIVNTIGINYAAWALVPAADRDEYSSLLHLIFADQKQTKGLYS
jgi:hypothetical protein